jgi:mannose-6-phosphate isomerase-like protein (cupin superfamily)
VLSCLRDNLADMIHDPVIGQRYRLTREGDVLRNELTADPGSEVPEHFHPHIEERFEILEGERSFHVNGEERSARQADRLVVPPGARHKFANVGSEVGRFIAEIEPAMDMEGFFAESAALARAGMFRRPGMPKGLRGALAASEFAERYSDTTVMLFPPRAVQRLAFPLLARVERRRRRRSSGTT